MQKNTNQNLLVTYGHLQFRVQKYYTVQEYILPLLWLILLLKFKKNSTHTKMETIQIRSASL